ncbi:MAG: glutamate synthase [Treponema sp.]|nr:glutamate synthase [Treponema sp.]
MKTKNIESCFGQRFIGGGSKDTNYTIHGTPGNALGSFLDGGTITVHGNVQDAVGDTMNEGTIIVHGNAGDALGYAMRGGSIFVKGDTGYRTGIHMKEYKEKRPLIVIGGKTGSFLGEYLAGGIIIVLGINERDLPLGNFTGTGMHGGKIFVRTKKSLASLPAQVIAEKPLDADLQEIMPSIKQFAELFNFDFDHIIKTPFCLLRPNVKNPYKQLYTPH